ncbi:MAG: hypothetical protein EBU83_04635 [bacterium]|jgi:hypothetical protein|nr:hypothetical protein [Candidatus Aquidulcis sp.]
MKTDPAKKVNIVSQCETWLAAAEAEHAELAKQIERIESDLGKVKRSHSVRIKEISTKLNNIIETIKAVISQEGDAASLEKRKSELESQLSAERQNPDLLKQIEDGENELKAISDKAQAAAAAVGHKKRLLDIAKTLAESFAQDKRGGAIEAPEYETLAEAVREYVRNIRFDVGISGTQIDQVVIWQVPNAQQPWVVPVSATESSKYLIKSLPKRLGWLSNFSPYAMMPKSSGLDFKNGDIRFVYIKTQADDRKEGKKDENPESPSDSKIPSWLKAYVGPGLPSLYSPEGNLGRSGLCFVKETSKFYSVWPGKFSQAFKTTKREFKQVGYEHRNVDVDYIELKDFDASLLVCEIYPHVHEMVKSAAAEMSSLQAAKTELAVRIRSAISEVADTSELFVERNQRLDAGEINFEVGAYWDAFVNAPWEFFVQGNCALLKHLCERKLEVPHVYSYPVKGHYGMRVRTRDHGWIYASMFCPPDALSPKTPIKTSEVVYLTNPSGQCTTHVKIGPCCLYIYTDD